MGSRPTIIVGPGTKRKLYIMKKSLVKKLSLHRETLRALEGEDVRKVVGGESLYTCTGRNTCASSCLC
jgi:hypothetical protein